MNLKLKSLTIFKRFLFVLAFIFLSLISFAGLNEIKKDGTRSVNATPIANKTIIVDCGHGKPDEGAVGFNGTTEQAINLSIGLKLQKLIEQSGGNVILTRSDENSIYSIDSKSIREKKVSDTKNRVEIGNNSNADIFISIHLNKYPQSSVYRGWQAFYQENSSESRDLANIIQENINKNIDYENNRKPMKITDVYIMEHVKIPAVIVECGFLSNKEESVLLQDESYQSKIAWGIFIGIQDYFFNKTIVNQ